LYIVKKKKRPTAEELGMTPEEYAEMQAAILRQRIDIVSGILKAIEERDAVMDICFSALTREAARDALEELGFSEIQAEFVLDMTLSRLTEAARAEYQEELDDLNSPDYFDRND
jgi:DNA gyrase subunit A